MAEPAIFEAPLRVRYAETDKMGVVYNANYFIWFEIGRVELMRSLGYSYQQMELDHLNLPVVEASCRYKHSALYDDELLITTRISQLRPSLIRFRYEVLRSNDRKLLAEGESTHLVVGPGMKKTRLPEKYWKPFSAAAGL